MDSLVAFNRLLRALHDVPRALSGINEPDYVRAQGAYIPLLNHGYWKKETKDSVILICSEFGLEYYASWDLACKEHALHIRIRLQKQTIPKA